MGKGCKVVVCGLASVGKTAILEQLLYGNHAVGSESRKTLEDVYVASVETDRGVKEQLRLYDTRGLHDGLELPKHYYSVADGFVLVYSVDSLESFKKVDVLKKEIDKSRDKREVPAHFHQAFKNTRYLVLVCSDLGGSKNVDCLRVSENWVETLLWKVYDRGQRGDAVMVIVLGNKTDLQEWRQVDPEAAQQWAQGEKVRLWEVSVTERDSLIEPFTVLTSRLTQPQSRSSFPLPGRRSRGTPSNDM